MSNAPTKPRRKRPDATEEADVTSGLLAECYRFTFEVLEGLRLTDERNTLPGATLRLKYRGDYVDAATFALPLLIEALGRRLTVLARCYGAGAPPADFARSKPPPGRCILHAAICAGSSTGAPRDGAARFGWTASSEA